MKKLLFILSFFILTQLFAQKNELNLGYRYGMATSKLKITKIGPFSRLNYSNLNVFNDKCFYLNYQHTLWDKYKVFFNAGADYAVSKYYLPIIAFKSKYNLENVEFTKGRMDVSLGLSKQFNLYESNKVVLELGYNLLYRIYFKNKKVKDKPVFSSNNEDWIKYTYHIETYHNYAYTTNFKKVPNKFTHLFTAKLKFKVFDNFYYNIGANYISYIEFYYNFNYHISYYMNNSPTPTGGEGHQGFTASPVKKSAKYFYLSTGITYKF